MAAQDHQGDEFPPGVMFKDEKQRDLALKVWKSLHQDERDRFELLENVGDGVYGTVLRARDNQTGNEVAIKLNSCMYPSGHHAEEVLKRRWYRELVLGRQLRHPGILELLHVCQPAHDLSLTSPLQHLATVHPLAVAGTLTRMIRQDAELAPDAVRELVRQGLESLRYLRARNVLHRDVKPDNILVSHDAHGAPRLILCDFGLARTLPDLQRSRQPESEADELMEGEPEVQKRDLPTGGPILTAGCNVVSPSYRPAELDALCSYDHSADMWSMACTLIQLFAKLRGHEAGEEARSVLVGRTTTKQEEPDRLKRRLKDIEAALGQPSRQERDRLPKLLQEAATALWGVADAAGQQEEPQEVACRERLIKKAFPAMPDQAAKLFACLCAWVPDDRLTPEQALAHAYFNPEPAAASVADVPAAGGGGAGQRPNTGGQEPMDTTPDDEAEAGGAVAEVEEPKVGDRQKVLELLHEEVLFWCDREQA